MSLSAKGKIKNNVSISKYNFPFDAQLVVYRDSRCISSELRIFIIKLEFNL